jgi:DNA repair protein RadD
MAQEMITLYPDQEQVIERLRAQMRKSKSILLQMPTGAGKTAVATYMLASAKNKQSRTIFTVPRRSLAKQTSQSFDDNGITHGMIAAGFPFNPYASTYIGMVDTMARRMDKLPDDVRLMIVDESHFGQNNLDQIIRHYKNKGAWVIGLSASPWKLSGKGLGCWYDSLVQGQSVRWLIDNGRLSEYKLFAPDSPDLSAIKVTAGDYAKGELADYMEADKVLVGNAVNHYREHAFGRLNIAYCTSIRHSQIVAQSFNNAGIPAAHIDGETPDHEQARIIRAFARREILVLCNCELLTFGFDLSMSSGMDVTIEAMSDLRPTKSLALQLQKWGRVLRRKDYPALIFDHANNWREHGLPCMEREWSLADRKQAKKGGDKAPATKQCDNCFHIHSPAPSCPECGHVYEVRSREVEEVDGTLKEIDRSVYSKPFKQAVSELTTLDELIAYGQYRQMRYPAKWAAKVLSARMRKQA